MIKRFNPDFSLSISHELAYMRETQEGGYVAHGDYATLFSELELVKADRDALERQLLISEAKCKGYFSDAATALIKCDALAVENGQLREMNSRLCAELQEYESDNDDFGPVPQSVVNCFALLTPNTDAALAAIEARGVEKFADFLGKKYQCEKGATARAKALKHIVFLSCRFAAELREAK
ncbi:hypothetical protein M2407_000060 [Serratia sp. BIGb0234]|uniref:hypothetical protein n=1 Tax=Serratia sp. BIGb0234 TaxID=2940614 RepID=UPI002166FCAA|nr:hypothetical protein [Serratia sp. BIGb0234]MCS4315761.1 hypothetical protein [Serratia sp. BIGb0234]